MSDEWFYVREKKKQGPVSYAQLRDLVLHGHLARADMVLPGGSTKWQAAESVDGLFPAAPEFFAPPGGTGLEPPGDEPSPDDLAVFNDATANRRRPHEGATVIKLGATSIGFAVVGLAGMIWMYMLPFALIALGLGVPVVVKGGADLHKMKLNLMDSAGESQTRLGRILALVGSILGGLELLVGVIVILFRVEVHYF